MSQSEPSADFVAHLETLMSQGFQAIRGPSEIEDGGSTYV